MKLKSIGLITAVSTILSCTNETNIPSNNSPKLNVNDSLTMVSFYKSTKGDLWSNIKWDLKDVQTWGGVTLMLHPDKNEYFVREISISDEVFPEGATLPSDIGNLKYLNVFMVGGFNLGGNIPESLFDLPLKYLVIGGQKIEGEFPKGIKKIAKTLEYLCIINTKLHGELPAELYECTNLKYPLDLSNNEFTGNISIKIKPLQNKIFLQRNNFTSIDWDFFTTPKDNLPVCSGNRLSGVVPTWVLTTDTWKSYESSLSIQQAGFGFTY